MILGFDAARSAAGVGEPISTPVLIQRHSHATPATVTGGKSKHETRAGAGYYQLDIGDFHTAGPRFFGG